MNRNTGQIGSALRKAWSNLRDATGSTATEYAVIAAFLSVLVVPILGIVVDRLNQMFYGLVTNAFSHVSGSG